MGFVDDDSESEAESNPLSTRAHEEVDLVNSKESLFHNRRTLSLNDPRTPEIKNNDPLSTTHLRRKAITESEEIWEELEDDALVDLSPSRRRGSTASKPLNSHLRGNLLDEDTNESTTLLARSGTGRSYRDKRRRRSVPISEIQERQRVGRSASPHEASGSWWKVITWWIGNEKKDKGKDIGNSIGNGSGDSA